MPIKPYIPGTSPVYLQTLTRRIDRLTVALRIVLSLAVIVLVVLLFLEKGGPL